MDRGGVEIDRYRGDTRGPHNATRDFSRPKDADDTLVSVSAPAASALHKMFDAPDRNLMHIRADGKGKITTQFKDNQGNPIGHLAVYDTKIFGPGDRELFAYQFKRHIVAVRIGADVEDVNNLREKNGEYHFQDRDGENLFIKPTNEIREAIEKDLSSLGLDNNKQYIPDSVGKGVLEHAANQEAKSETDPVKQQALKDKINNETVDSYKYDEGTDQYKFYIREARTGKTDWGNMREVAIDRESLPSQVEKWLEYNETKQAVKEAYGLPDEDMRNIIIHDGKIHINTNDGKTTYIPEDDMKNIKDHLAKKGLDYNGQWISDSVRGAAIKHAIDQETDPAKKAALKDGRVDVYDYTKEGKRYVYHILTEDEGIERFSLTDKGQATLLKKATLNAVRRFGELPDGTKLTDDMEVDFAPNDKTKFVVKGTDGRTYTLTGASEIGGEGGEEKLGDAIMRELNVEPRYKDGILTDKNPETMIDEKGTDSKAEELKDKLAEYEIWTKRIERFLNALKTVNDMCLNASRNFDQAAAGLLHAQDTPSQQQPIGAEMTQAACRMYKQKVKDEIARMQKEIEIHSKKSGPGEREITRGAIKAMGNVRHMIEENRGISGEDQAELLHDIDIDSRANASKFGQ